MANLTGKTIGQLALLTGITSDTLFAVELSGSTFHIPYSGLSIGGGGSYEEVTYDELYSMYTGSTLIPGGYYVITDFQSIYDQPDYDFNNNQIITGNSKTGITEPLLVFATSSNTLSNVVFSPNYPYDKISYDINYTTTEISSTPSKGRITERIDEFNNRTDYDHRNIYFKRYRLYTIRIESPLNGQIQVLSGGTVTGQSTSFTLLNVGDVIFETNNSIFYEITSITDDTTMSISGETIVETFGFYNYYLGIEESNGNNGYFSYRRSNIKIDDFVEYTTFGNAISENGASNTYVGNFAAQNIAPGNFILANNVFLEGEYENNVFGNYCYNNTFGTDNSNNVFGDYCHSNVSTNDIDDNVIGNYFNNNIINTNLTRNSIGNFFEYNRLFGENGSDFRSNIIDNFFNNNTIYSDFYDNKIANNFNNNIIGDYGNLDRFRVYRNVFGNGSNGNRIWATFQNNVIGSGFQDNNIYGEFYKNYIKNGFNQNSIGWDFNSNDIGNGFNNNTIGDEFNTNKIEDYFGYNYISYGFSYNQIANSFNFNRFGNLTQWSWYDTIDVTIRNYQDLIGALDGGGVGNKIVGKQFIMWDTVSNEYHKVQFTQWTQSGNGGGFSYNRQLIYPTTGPNVTFTKTNNGSEVDIIVPGVLEITRGGNNLIYNVAVEGSASSNSPQGTQWNSEYTTFNNGANFIQNKIGNEFNNNIIYERFGYNQIGNNFYNNLIASDFGYGGGNDYGNVIGENFNNNNVGEYFYNNKISNYFISNTIGDYFQWNNVETQLNGVNFVTYYNTITGFSYTALGSTASDNTYNGLTGSTNGNGINATFDVVVSSSIVTSVNIVNTGNYYETGNTITILGSQIGGTDSVDDVNITITQVIEPSVYESYTCHIFERQGGTKRLSYYDSTDILTITDINQ